MTTPAISVRTAAGPTTACPKNLLARAIGAIAGPSSRASLAFRMPIATSQPIQMMTAVTWTNKEILYTVNIVGTLLSCRPQFIL